MPSAILNDEDIKKALDFLTGYSFNIKTIVRKEITEKGELEIFWSHKSIKNKNNEANNER